MADVKISELPAATALTGVEEIPVVQGATTKKATATQIQTFAAGSGANTSLSNISATSIPDDLITSSAVTNWIISTSGRGDGGPVAHTNIKTGDNSYGGPSGISGNLRLFSGNAVGAVTGTIQISTGDSSSAASGPIQIGTGGAGNGEATGYISFNTASSGTSGPTGALQFSTGTTAGSRGKISFIDGSEGTVGHIWTSTNAFGDGTWAAPSGGDPFPYTSPGADVLIYDQGSVLSVDLGNVRRMYDDNGVLALSYRQRRLYASDGTTTAANWGTHLLYDGSEIQSVNWTARSLIDTSSNSTLNWNARALIDPDGATQRMNWSNSARITFNTALNLQNNAGDPGSGSAGDMYFNTTLNKLKFYNGTTWETVTSV